MDAHDMWRDTMLIVNTDHGFLLGEHDWWGKNDMPDFNEIAHTPLFLYDPVSGIRGERRDALTQTIDLAPTLLDFFGKPIPPDMRGHSLLPVIRENAPGHAYALFGYFNGPINITDGQYVYMRARVDDAVQMHQYTMMPTAMDSRLPVVPDVPDPGSRAEHQAAARRAQAVQPCRGPEAGAARRREGDRGALAPRHGPAARRKRCARGDLRSIWHSEAGKITRRPIGRGKASPSLFCSGQRKRKKGILEIPEVLFLAAVRNILYAKRILSLKVSDADVFSKFVQLHPPVVRHVQAQL